MARIQVDVVEAAVDRALVLLADTPTVQAKVTTLTHRLTVVESELANLAEPAAKGGAVPAVLQALELREAERSRLRADLGGLRTDHAGPMNRSVLRERLRSFLNDWDSLLIGNTAEAKALLGVALAGRIQFTPTEKGKGYELRVPIAFDRVMTAAVPEFSGLQDRVASPSGTAYFHAFGRVSGQGRVTWRPQRDRTLCILRDRSQRRRDSLAAPLNVRVSAAAALHESHQAPTAASA